MEFYFSFDGRVSLGQFWTRFVLPYIGLYILCVLLDMTATGGMLTMVFSLAAIWPSLAVTAKRFHDRNMSAKWIIWFAILPVLAMIIALVIGAPAVGGLVAIGLLLVQLVIIYCLPGTDGMNTYGPDPRWAHESAKGDADGEGGGPSPEPVPEKAPVWSSGKTSKKKSSAPVMTKPAPRPMMYRPGDEPVTFGRRGV